MKTLLTAAIVSGLMVLQASGQGAQGAKITQRARDLVNQNNARQGVPQQPQPAAPPPAQPQKVAAPSPAQIQQQNINKIKNDIAAILAGAEVSQEEVKKLAADLAGAARGARKPSSAVINRLVNSIATNLVGKTLGPPEQQRLAENLEAVVNGSSFSKLQTDAYVSDVQKILQTAGVKAEDAASTAKDVKAAVSEIQR